MKWMFPLSFNLVTEAQNVQPDIYLLAEAAVSFIFDRWVYLKDKWWLYFHWKIRLRDSFSLLAGKWMLSLKNMPLTATQFSLDDLVSP